MAMSEGGVGECEYCDGVGYITRPSGNEKCDMCAGCVVDDGGPAFPVSDEASRFKVAGVFGGMTLRDYFAGQALAGMMSVPSSDDPRATVAYAYRIADALLAARGRS